MQPSPTSRRHTMLRRFAAVAILVALAVPAEAKRMALVVGNGAYTGVAPLKNPVNDARRLADRLEALEFEVTVLTDVAGDAFWPDFDAFVDRTDDAEIVLFFYSGHAFQLDNVNYLVPIDARLNALEAIAEETWSLNRMLERFAAAGTNTVVMLDACRNNPLPPSMQSATMGGGLARIETGADLLTVFATQPNMVAYEGTGDTSFFTQALLDHMETEGASLVDVVRNVRNQVRTETNRRQIPWSGGNLSRAFYFKPQIERRTTLSDLDIENLLLNFPPEQRPAILEKLAETMGLDMASLNTRIDLIEPSTDPTVFIIGDTVDPTAEVPREADGADGRFSVPESPLPRRRPQLASLGDIAGGAVGVLLVEDTAPLDPIVGPDGITGVPVRARPVSTDMRLASAGTSALGRTMSAVLVSRANLPRPVPLVDIAPIPVVGREFFVDDEDSRAVLLELAPAVVTELDIAAPEGRDLAAAVQSELARLGCYRDRVDGAFGQNSKFALTSYYLAKGILFEDLEPTIALLRQLEIEPTVVCTGTQVRAPKEVRRVAAAPPPPQAAAPRRPPSQVSRQAEEAIESGKRTPGIRMLR